MSACHKRRRSLRAALVPTLACVAGAAMAMSAAIAQQSTPPTGPAPKTTPKAGIDYWQPDWMVRELWGPGRMPKGMMTRLLRHTTYMSYGVPAEYDGARSTVTPSPETTAAGAKIYGQQCAGCHGKDGLGDGDAENALSPSPALLAYMIRRPISVDEYLLWSISDGGAQFQSQMPAFKEKLSRDQIWQVIAYMRAGFPHVSADGKSVPPAKAK
ncbi:MAG: cytochrome c [Hyphomicrobiaceae bacterium]